MLLTMKPDGRPTNFLWSLVALARFMRPALPFCRARFGLLRFRLIYLAVEKGVLDDSDLFWSAQRQILTS